MLRTPSRGEGLVLLLAAALALVALPLTASPPPTGPTVALGALHLELVGRYREENYPEFLSLAWAGDTLFAGGAGGVYALALEAGLRG